jgi:hypothetical protein
MSENAVSAVSLVFLSHPFTAFQDSQLSNEIHILDKTLAAWVR